MNKKISLIVILIAVATVGWFYRDKFLVTDLNIDKESVLISEPTSIPTSIPLSLPAEKSAWNVFQNYLENAKNHNLEGVKTFSHQMSSACLDKSREAECFSLMDNVYNLMKNYKSSDFVTVRSNDKQMIMYTARPEVTLIYFTRSENQWKVLGIKFCYEIEDTATSCTNNIDMRDSDGDGWWNSVEELF